MIPAPAVRAKRALRLHLALVLVPVLATGIALAIYTWCAAQPPPWTDTSCTPQWTISIEPSEPPPYLATCLIDTPACWMSAWARGLP